MRKAVHFITRSSLVRTSGIYTFSNALNAAIPFFLIPVLTRFLSPEDYGLVAMFLVLNAIIGPLTGLSVHGAVSRRYFSEHRSSMPQYVGTCVSLLILSTTAVALLFWWAGPRVTQYTGIPVSWHWTVLLLSFSQFVILLPLTLWQVRKKAASYGLFQVSHTLLNFGLSLFFVVSLQWNWEGRILGQVLAAAFFALISLFILYRNKDLSFTWDKASARHALSFGLPLIPHAFGGVLLNWTDRFFLTNLVGLAQTGVYMIAFQLSSLIGLLVISFNNAYVPWLFEKLGSKNRIQEQKIVGFTYLYFGGIVLLSGLYAALVPFILPWFVGDKFQGADPFLFWLCMGFAFGGMYSMVTNYIFYSEKTHTLAWITILSAAITVALNLWLIRAFGAIGAAWAFMLGNLTQFGLTWVVSARLHPMPWTRPKFNLFS